MMYLVTLYKAAESDPEVSSYEVYVAGATASGAMRRARQLLPSLVQLASGVSDVWWCAWQVPGTRAEGLRTRRFRRADS